MLPPAILGLPGLRPWPPSSCVSWFAPEVLTLAGLSPCRSPGPHVRTSLAAYLARHASLGSAHSCATLVLALALELLATPWAATPVMSLPRCVGVPSVLISHAHEGTHVCIASVSLGRPRTLLVLARCPTPARFLAFAAPLSASDLALRPCSSPSCRSRSSATTRAPVRLPGRAALPPAYMPASLAAPSQLRTSTTPTPEKLSPLTTPSYQ
jgi:hypothetical protein